VFIKRERYAYPLPSRGRIRIGRGPDNDIRIDHRSVSRQHLELCLGDTLEVQDLESSNGTWLFPAAQPTALDDVTVNSSHDRRLSPGERVALGVGDMVRAGVVLLTVQGTLLSSYADALRATSDDHPVPALIDPEMKRIYDLALKAAASNISVLILGETGVGKDVLAETIHRASPRRERPFMRLNCGALSETLLESELFGYQRGAFTGANESKEGLLEAATTGTVFLDEIGELPMATQVKLLHVIETGEVLRVGSTKSRRIDVRVLSATNRDLARCVSEGSFRKDLYFRINGVSITVPPLRERPDEILPLARGFLRRFCKDYRIPEPDFTPEAQARLVAYSWPGNVRELRNAMERLPILCGSGSVRAEHLPREGRLSPVATLGEFDFAADATDAWTATTMVGPPPSARLPGNERERILQALELCGGNQTRAAQMLGISRRTIVNRLNDLQLPRPRKRGE
jgi:DNA-binding NtrC family response regulator